MLVQLQGREVWYLQFEIWELPILQLVMMELR